MSASGSFVNLLVWGWKMSWHKLGVVMTRDVQAWCSVAKRRAPANGAGVSGCVCFPRVVCPLLVLGEEGVAFAALW